MESYIMCGREMLKMITQCAIARSWSSAASGVRDRTPWLICPDARQPKPAGSDLLAGRPQDRKGPLDGMTIIDPRESTVVGFQTGGQKNSVSAGIPENVEPNVGSWSRSNLPIDG